MKQLVLAFLLLIAVSTNAQTQKPDYSTLTTINMVRLSLKGLDLQNTIWQDSIVKLKELKLIGTDAENFEIVYYHFKTNYKKSLTIDEFYNNQIPVPMNSFFKDLEKNCRISFEDIVVKQTETGKLFKILPLTVIIKT